MEIITEQRDHPEILAGRLASALEQYDRVLWLIPGGSNIGISVAAMRMLAAELSRGLFIMQTDERFGSILAPDANWKQLFDMGFDQKHAVTTPVLDDHKERSLEEAPEYYADVLAEGFRLADYVIGQFGIGADGHTAGVKPNSPATESTKSNQSGEIVCGYQADDFARITMTPKAIRQVDEALVFAFGEAKYEALERLSKGEVYDASFPAGVFNELKKSSLYTDQAVST